MLSNGQNYFMIVIKRLGQNSNAFCAMFIIIIIIIIISIIFSLVYICK